MDSRRLITVISGALPSPRISLWDQEPSSLFHTQEKVGHAGNRTHSYHAQKWTIYAPNH